MGDFNNVTLGTGAIEYNSVDIGFLKGNVEWTYEYDIKKFKTGVPRKLQGQIVAELNASLKGSYAELKASNVAMALGGLSVSTTTASPVTVADGDNAEFTFAADPVSGLEYIQLAPGVVASTFTVSAIENVAEDTTYASGKYLLFPNNGRVYRIVTGSGDIPSGATVRVTYGYTPISGKRINLGTQFSLPAQTLQFTHTRPNTGKDVIIYMPKAVINGSVKLTFDEENFIVNDVTFDAVEDTTNPTFPFGYYFEET